MASASQRVLGITLIAVIAVCSAVAILHVVGQKNETSELVGADSAPAPVAPGSVDLDARHSREDSAEAAAKLGEERPGLVSSNQGDLGLVAELGDSAIRGGSIEKARARAGVIKLDSGLLDWVMVKGEGCMVETERPGCGDWYFVEEEGGFAYIEVPGVASTGPTLQFGLLGSEHPLLIQGISGDVYGADGTAIVDLVGVVGEARILPVDPDGQPIAGGGVEFGGVVAGESCIDQRVMLFAGVDSERLGDMECEIAIPWAVGQAMSVSVGAPGYYSVAVRVASSAMSVVLEKGPSILVEMPVLDWPANVELRPVLLKGEVCEGLAGWGLDWDFVADAIWTRKRRNGGEEGRTGVSCFEITVIEDGRYWLALEAKTVGRVGEDSRLLVYLEAVECEELVLSVEMYKSEGRVVATRLRPWKGKEELVRNALRELGLDDG